MELVAVGDDVTTTAARRLIGEYLAWVAGVAAEQHGLVFDTAAMLASDIDDRGKFYASHGRFYLLRDDFLRDGQAFVGVGALQRIDETTAEIQRMYVQPPYRGRGAARLLLDRLLADARTLGCDVVRLESLKSLAPAHALYRAAGFIEVLSHDDNRMRRYQDEAALDAYRSSAVFMARRLR